MICEKCKEDLWREQSARHRAEAEAKEAQAEVGRLEQAISGMRSDESILQARLREATEAVKAYEAKRGKDKEAARLAVKAETDTLRKKLASADKDLKRLERAVAAKEKAAAQNKAKADSAKADTNAMKAQMAEMARKLDAEKSARKAAETDAGKAAKAKDKLDKENAALRDKLEHVRGAMG